MIDVDVLAVNKSHTIRTKRLTLLVRLKRLFEVLRGHGGLSRSSTKRQSYLSDSFCNASAGSRRRQRLAILLEDFEPLIDDLTKLGIYFGFIVAVATLTNDSRALADEALVLVGPFNDLYVPCAVVHDMDLRRAGIG
jgi:hypothetical protein